MEQYPVKTVIITNIQSLAVYSIGFLIMYRAGHVFAVLYAVYLLLMETRIIKSHCINCYYYGKRCGFGKGKISSLLFRKGNQGKFCIAPLTWKDLIPDMLIVLIPLITGIILIVLAFSLMLLISMFMIILFATMGNSFVRGKLTCNNCKQRELGCSAYELFNSGKN